MSNLTIKLTIKDRIEAYRLINYLNLKYKITESSFDNQKVVVFDKNNKIDNFLKYDEKTKKSI